MSACEKKVKRQKGAVSMCKKIVKRLIVFVFFIGLAFGSSVMLVNAADTKGPDLYYINDRYYPPTYPGGIIGIQMFIKEPSGISDAWMVYKNGTEKMHLSLYDIEKEESEVFFFWFYTDLYAKGGRYEPYELVLVDGSPNKNQSVYTCDKWGDFYDDADIDFKLEQKAEFIVASTESAEFENDWKALQDGGTIVVRGSKLPADFLTYAKEKDATIIVPDKGAVAEVKFKAKDLSAKALTEGMEISVERDAFEKKQVPATEMGMHHLIYTTGKNAGIPMTMRVGVDGDIYWKSFQSSVNAYKVLLDERSRISDAFEIKEKMEFGLLDEWDEGNVEFELSEGLEEGNGAYAVAIQTHNHNYKASRVDEEATFSEDGTTYLECEICGHKKIQEVKQVVLPELSYTTTVYNAKTKKPSVTVKDIDGNELKSGSDYELSYQSGRILPGEYYVKITLKGKYEGSKKIYFRILPKKPSGIDAELYGYNDIKISWKSSTGADGYHIYEYYPETEEYVLLTTTTKTYYKLADLEDDTTYHYAVEAFDLDKTDNERYVSERTEVASITTMKNVENLIIEKVSNSEVEISWDEVSAATGYQVSASASKTETKRISTTSKLAKVYEPSKNKTLYYKVRAYKTEGDEKIYTPWTAVTAYKLRYVYALNDLTAKLTKANAVKLEWDRSSSANRYYIYHKTADMEEYEEIGMTEDDEFKVEDLQPGMKQQFKVVPAYDEENAEILTGKADEASVYTLKTLDAPEVVKSGSKVKVRWENISGETGYQISKSTTADETKIVSTYATTKGTYKTVSATKGKEYYYRVRVYKTVNGKKIYSEWSEATVFTRL